ncbi:MAG TPA: hypothetical protein ENJ55_00030 [Rhizobiales bacterium]|nr:hypothetical protein [Hyphomicrobiales bacterium]
MFKMMLLGITGFIFIALFGLSGVVAFKTASNASRDQKQIFNTVSIYKKAPLATKDFIRTAMKECLEAKVDGNLPSYYTDFAADSLLAAVKYAAKHKVKSLGDPKIRAFVKKYKKQIMRDAIKMSRRMARESKKVQRRMMKSVSWMSRHRSTLRACINVKVDKLAVTEL